KDELKELASNLQAASDLTRKDIVSAVRKAVRLLRFEAGDIKHHLNQWYKIQQEINEDRYNSKLFTNGTDSPANIPAVPAMYGEERTMKDGREILNACFDANLGRDPRILAFGEDVGSIGDVNQGFAGLQKKY